MVHASPRSFNCLLAAVAASLGLAAQAAPQTDSVRLAAIDDAYQAAVKANDAKRMDEVLADDFVLVQGAGRVVKKADLLAEARGGKVVYEQQDEVPGTRTVRVWGDTAVVTALLWIKGSESGKPFDRKLWFSDVYVRTAAGWRYVLGQVGATVERDGRPV